jgi:hypothetical protein
MTKHALFGAILLMAVLTAYGQQAADRVELGQLAGGASLTFARGDSAEWGLEIAGGSGPRMTQPEPAQVELFRGPDNVRQLAAGYQTAQKENNAVTATAKVTGDGPASFAVEDRWTISGAALLLDRKVNVTGSEEDAGFLSAIRLATAPTVTWENAAYLVPGLLYGDSSHAGGGVPSSVSNYRAKRFSIRKDHLSAPLFGMSLPDGRWAAVLDRRGARQFTHRTPCWKLISDKSHSSPSKPRAC